MPRLIGQRIMLREYRLDDLDGIRKWVNDAQSTKYLSTRFWPVHSMMDSQEFVSHMMQSSHNAYNFVIADVQDESYIGQMDMYSVNWRLRCATLGIVIGKQELRGQGIGQEALMLLETFAFRTLGLERLEMEVHMDNKAAIHCYEKAGFVTEGVKRHAFFTDGQFSDVGIMAILREDYEKRRLHASV